MLYDHMDDFDETDNLSNTADFSEIREELSNKMLENRGKNYFKENEISKLE